MKRLRPKVLLISASVLALLAACVLASFFPHSPLGPGILPVTPEAAARLNSPCGALNPIQLFRVLDTVTTPRGKLVTFNARCPIRNSLGYAYMEREEDGIYWSNHGASSSGGGGWDPGGRGWVFVDFGGTGGEPHESEAIVYGYILSPQVRVIEAVLGDGRTLRQDVGGDGTFTLRAPGARLACQVRLLGADGRALDTFAAAPNESCS